jgi:hypothetical protein
MSNTIDLSSIEPVAFEWDDTATTIGVVAQDISTMAGIGSAITVSANNWNSSISVTDPYEAIEKRLAAVESVLAEEKAIREKCPAVKQAYDEYRLLLELAKG